MQSSFAWSVAIAIACAVSACHAETPPAVSPPTAGSPAPTCPAVPVSPPVAAKPATPPCPEAKPDAKAPPRSPSAAEDPTANRLAELYEKQPKSSGAGTCTVDAPRTRISEISIERTRCFGDCEAYSLTLHADGSLEFYGEDNTKPYNAHHGTIDVRYFDQLARLAEDIGWFGLQNNYLCSVTDQPTTFTSLVKNKVRKTIRHYAPGESGPPRLYFFERAVDDYRRFIEWTD